MAQIKIKPLCPEIIDELVVLAQGDVEKAFESDPAVREKSTVISQYPGFLAITLQRFAHKLKNNDAPEGFTRGLTEWARRQTGIELHPGTQIGQRFFIDHGTGTVVGETAEIGDDCTLFHGVTLGNKQIPDKTQQNHKRHPTLENGVTVCIGAKVLGGDTIIGEGSTIGAGIIVTKSLPPGTRMFFGKEGQIITKNSGS
ncbi:hypothetical protein KBB89_02340 [Candidatus Gracilibacteria bacterium]|nr:hypothetical protein [Candidatus Gracilibacteria bacterium]